MNPHLPPFAEQPPLPHNHARYDAENRVVNYLSAAYTYDGNGLRVNKASGGTTTVYAFSGSKVIAEYDNGAAPTSPSREYVYSGGALLAKIDSSGTKYYHQDHLSNRYVTDSSGNEAAEMGTFPYGESWYNASGDKLFFTTYERDSESGNDYAQARYNMSRLGRFSSPDPIPGSASDPQSLNRYSYVRNTPIMLTDSSGLCPASSQNRDAGESQDAKGGGPSSMGSDAMGEPDPQGGVTVCLDGGDITASPGQPGFPILGGGGAGVALLPVYGYSWQTETDGPPDDLTITGEWAYGLLGYALFSSPSSTDPPGGGTDRQKKFKECLEKFGDTYAKSKLDLKGFDAASAAAAAAEIDTSAVLSLWENENKLSPGFPSRGPKGEIGPIQVRPGVVTELRNAGILPTKWNSDLQANLTTGALYYERMSGHYNIPETSAAAAYNGGPIGWKKGSQAGQPYQNAFNASQPGFRNLVNCMR